MSDTDETGTLYEPHNEDNPTRNTQKVNTKEKVTKEAAHDISNTKIHHIEIGARQKVPKVPVTITQKSALTDETEGNPPRSGQQTKKVAITEGNLLESERKESLNYQGPQPEGIPSEFHATQGNNQPRIGEPPSYAQLGPFKGLNTWIPPTTYVTPPSATGITENWKPKENWQQPSVKEGQDTAKPEDTRKSQQEANRPNYNYSKVHNQAYAPMADILTGSPEPQHQQGRLSPQVNNSKKTHQEDFFLQDKHLGNEEDAHNTSYLNLPTGDKFINEPYNKNHTSKYRKDENKICTRCGENGHIRKYCIHLYLKRCTTASSRQSTPEPNMTEQQKIPPAKHQHHQKRDEIPSQPPLKEKRNPDIPSICDAREAYGGIRLAEFNHIKYESHV